MEVTIRRIGDELGVELPQDILSGLGLAEGSRLHLVQTEGGLLLTTRDETFERGMALYREFADEYRDALRELAK